ncbi:MAG: acetate--CoA ligase family protein, partial [Methanoregula sp.]|nr:acetate--CoA ligase family protein [Methanoregula sp.]
MTEREGYELLKEYHIPTPQYSVVRTQKEAVSAADTIGYPVVMKIVSPQIVHKSDAGGVITGIATPEDAARAFLAIQENVVRFNPTAEITGIIVESQVRSGLEIFIGGKTDPTFGKVLTVGMGGKLVEFLNDVSIIVLPSNEHEIRSVIESLHGYRLVAGYRGDPPRDAAFLRSTVMTIATLFIEQRTIV